LESTGKKLLVVSVLMRQQTILCNAEKRIILDRILSLNPAHIKPVVRGRPDKILRLAL
jgi:hypothetical protein